MGNLIEVAAICYIIYLIYKWWQGSQPENKISLLETQAQKWKESSLKDPLNLGTEQQKFVLDSTETDYLHLKERFKNNPVKSLELANDWCEYTEAINDLTYASNMLDVDIEHNAGDRYGENAKEPHIKRYEIEKRFQEMLGEKFTDRWNQYNNANPGPFDNILEDLSQEIQKK